MLSPVMHEKLYEQFVNVYVKSLTNRNDYGIMTVL
jgi:hypothetical protein